MIDERTTRANKVACPDCDDLMEVRSNIKWGERVICPNCDTELEVISTNPIELDWVFEDADYDYEDDDDDDY
jgi:alpha-aminoadipate carrier protein LysW